MNDKGKVKIEGQLIFLSAVYFRFKTTYVKGFVMSKIDRVSFFRYDLYDYSVFQVFCIVVDGEVFIYG